MESLRRSSSPPTWINNGQGLKIKQEIVILKNSELSFSLNETEAFFLKLAGIKLSRNNAELIQKATEGWTGGLILLSESIKNIPADTKQNFLNKKITEKLKKEAFDFFLNGIFNQKDKNIQKNFNPDIHI